MRRIFYIAALLAVAGYAAAQEMRTIRISSFERCPNCIDINPVYDNTGKGCARIRFSVQDTTMVIAPNNGYMQRETLPGVIILYVPISTQRLTLMANGVKPLNKYKLPIRLDEKATYDADVEYSLIENTDNTDGENNGSGREKQNIHPYIGLGWNVLPLNGPELALGVDINHHVIELSGVYGLKKTEPLFYYSAKTKDERPIAAWQYAAIRGSLSYGYDMMLKSPPCECSSDYRCDG